LESESNMKCLLCGKDLTKNAKVLGLGFHEMEHIHAHAHLEKVAKEFSDYIRKQKGAYCTMGKALQEYDFIQGGNILERSCHGPR